MSRPPLAVLPPRLFGSTDWYDLMTSYQAVYIDYDMRYDKRAKAVHRYDIADTRGRLALTVPVSRPDGFSSGNLRWTDVSVSAHGRWWEVQRIALESAYGGTPFFEYMYPSLAPLFTPRPLDNPESITDLCRRADHELRRLAGISTFVLDKLPDGITFDDYRRAPVPPSDRIYRQLRADTLGFIPGLSLLDRLFNTGQ